MYQKLKRNIMTIVVVATILLTTFIPSTKFVLAEEGSSVQCIWIGGDEEVCPISILYGNCICWDVIILG